MANEQVIRNFDTTTKKGIKEIIKDFNLTEYAKVTFLPGYFWYKLIFKNKEDKRVFVERLISEGKNKGYKKIKIKLDDSFGGNIEIPIPGIKISTGMNLNDKFEIEVEYL